jgi:hypothetical protein
VRTVARALLAVGAFLGAVALGYGIASGEEAGTVMLALAAGLALLIGGYLVSAPDERAPLEPAASGRSGHEASAAYLPHASVWPFWIGLGAVIVGNGLALGLWGLLPGTIVTVVGVIGFARQSRHRD